MRVHSRPMLDIANITSYPDIYQQLRVFKEPNGICWQLHAAVSGPAADEDDDLVVMDDDDVTDSAVSSDRKRKASELENGVSAKKRKPDGANNVDVITL